MMAQASCYYNTCNIRQNLFLEVMFSVCVWVWFKKCVCLLPPAISRSEKGSTLIHIIIVNVNIHVTVESQ
jgi:hypothetical protein